LPAAEGQEAGWLIHLQDVTALQRHTRQTITLFDLISHKLRTPLTLIRGPLELLGEGLISIESTEWPELRDMLMKGLRRLCTETDQLLDLAGMLGRPLVNAQYAALNTTEITESVQRACRDLNLPTECCTLRYTATRSLHLNLPALEMILRQLLDNARKFHPAHAPHVQIIVRDDETGGVRLEVEDDGPGIPPELQEQVWLPFYQVDRWRTGEVPGIGMGLTIVANYVWSAGGRCWIERAASGGARVCLTIPTVNTPVND
jgi:signal transduction histidine kinase